jgi:Domain of unknown function (DUF4424)
MTEKLTSTCIAALGLAFATPHASANDSSSAIGLGGLELTRNDAVSMDSEDLYLSPGKVVVKYRFTNNSSKDVETLVTFPLPPIPYGITGYLGDQAYPDWNNFAFETLVDGKAVPFEKTVRIEVNGKDVSKRLQQLGWAIDYWSDMGNDFSAKLDALTQQQKDAFVKEGLLKWGDKDKKYIQGAWQVITYITRKQLFPAGKTISVQHSYDPIEGGSVAGMLERQSRKEDYFGEYAADHCIDKAFIKAFDKKRYTGKLDEDGQDVGMYYSDVWLNYVLKSGANWKGPIKDFRMVVDKVKPENLVSFCASGVKKIGSTQFEVRKKNFEPTSDLNILIVQFYSPDPT